MELTADQIQNLCNQGNMDFCSAISITTDYNLGERATEGAGIYLADVSALTRRSDRGSSAPTRRSPPEDCGIDVSIQVEAEARIFLTSVKTTVTGNVTDSLEWNNEKSQSAVRNYAVITQSLYAAERWCSLATRLPSTTESGQPPSA